MSTKLIVSLDVDKPNRAMKLVDQLYPKVGLFKVGMQLFTIEGPSILQHINRKGGKVFLDLKLFDIPNTVKNAVKAAREHQVFSLSLHILGGIEMLKVASSIEGHPLLWGVTLLTSLDDGDLRVLGVKGKIEQMVQDLALLAKQAHLDGVICSAREIEKVREACGDEIAIITPGIRMMASSDDQKRQATPRQAAMKGANYIVVGRPILESSNPIETIDHILKEIRD